MSTLKKDFDNDGGSLHSFDFDFPTEFVFYAVVATFLMVVALMFKLLCDGGGVGEDERRATESSGLLCTKEDPSTTWYGTLTDQDDIESGCSGSGSSGSCSSDDDDLYDGKICVICYDDHRSCFFIPCGHSVTCFTCAKRITSEENKSCPICRTCIHKVKITNSL